MTDYQYDAVGRVTSIQQHGVTGGDAVAEKRIDFTYDADGQYATVTRYADLAGTELVATATYTFDAAYELVGLTYTSGTTTLASYTYAYDAAGNVTQMKSSADATTGNAWGVVDYTYDNTNQLKTATYTTFANAPANENYGYDANGNQDAGGNTVQSTGDNRLATDAAGYNYLYDADGNEIAKYQGSAPVDNQIPSDATDITTYTWDYRNRLTEVDSFANDADYLSGTKTQVVTYAYDAFNRLVKETVTAGSTVTQEAFAYDGTNAVLEFQKTGSGNLAASDLSDRYLWGPAVDQILADEKVSSPGTVLWGLADNEGTIRDIVDNSGSVVDHRVFNSFGEMTSESAPATDFVFGYTGQMFDKATGLQDNLERWYDPSTGRWLSQDPLGLAAGPNPYAYCGNSPMTHTDPLGLCEEGGGGEGASVLAANTKKPTPNKNKEALSKWTDSNGNLLAGKIIAIRGDSVLIEFPDGSRVLVKTKWLSQSDQKYVGLLTQIQRTQRVLAQHQRDLDAYGAGLEKLKQDYARLSVLIEQEKARGGKADAAIERRLRSLSLRIAQQTIQLNRIRQRLAPIIQELNNMPWYEAAFLSLGQSFTSMGLTWKGIWQSLTGNPRATQTWADAYDLGVLGQTLRSSGFYYYGTRGALAVATAAMSLAVLLEIVGFLAPNATVGLTAEETAFYEAQAARAAAVAEYSEWVIKGASTVLSRARLAEFIAQYDEALEYLWYALAMLGR